MFNKVIATPAFVHSFTIRDKIYLLSDLTVQVYGKTSFELECENQIFEQGGLSKSLILDNSNIRVIK